jgi:hypothetical protein
MYINILGISVGAIFSYLEETNLAAAIGNFDDYVKAWLWKSLKKRRDMRFYQSKVRWRSITDLRYAQLIAFKQQTSRTIRTWNLSVRKPIANSVPLLIEDGLIQNERQWRT